VKTLFKILVTFFLSSVVFSPVLSQTQNIQSVNKWSYGFDAFCIPDTAVTKSIFADDHKSQIFIAYGNTIDLGPVGLPYWNFQDTWQKNFSLSSISDTTYLDSRFISGKNLKKVNVFIAVQNSNTYCLVGNQKQEILLDSTWTTLKWSMKGVKDFSMFSFTRFYIAFQMVGNDSCYIGSSIQVKNLRGTYNDGTTIIYDKFYDPLANPVSSGNYVPTEFKLEQNYPNPFNPTTTISFDLPKETNVTLKVYNTLGAEVATLVNKVMPTGHQSVVFNATKLASGMYVYRLQSGNFVETKKMILLK
jgi:hypothetical protein